MPKEVRYPDITVKLVGHNGNAFAILGRVKMALHEADVPESEIKVFFDEAIRGDYDHLLQTAMQWVNVA